MNEVGRTETGDERQSVVALRYNESDGAPRVVAKGYGDIAQAIMERAEKHGLYVHRSPELVRLLMRVDLDDRIPPELYVAVAELLAWVYQLETAMEPKRPD
jgi:flagellar biosynthesis protein